MVPAEDKFQALGVRKSVVDILREGVIAGHASLGGEKCFRIYLIDELLLKIGCGDQMLFINAVLDADFPGMCPLRFQVGITHKDAHTAAKLLRVDARIQIIEERKLEVMAVAHRK